MSTSSELLRALVTDASTPETVKQIADIQAAIATETQADKDKIQDLTSKYAALQTAYIELVKTSAFPPSNKVEEAPKETTFEELLHAEMAKNK